jgi:DNA-binding NarL/FixJ family response regulator
MRSILFADNDQDFLNTRAEFLQSADYRVVKAFTFEQAQQSLEEVWTPVAILDIRLTEDDDEKDLSGLILAKLETCRNVAKIILSGHLTPEIVRELLRIQRNGRRLAIQVIGKEEDPEALVEAVERVFADGLRMNWELRIEWKGRDPFSMVHLIEAGHDTQILLNRAEEVEDLFRRLFWRKNQIRIERLLWQQPGRAALVVFTFKENAAPEGFVVVFGLRDRVAKEAQQYAEFAPDAPSLTSTVLKSRAETTHFAANAYVLAQADLEQVYTLHELYRMGPEGKFNQCLNNFFLKTHIDWQRKQRILEKRQTTIELLRRRLGFTGGPDDLAAFGEQIQEILHCISALGNSISAHLSDDQFVIRFGKQVFTYPDPRRALSQVYPFDQPAVLAKTSGWLSGENILVSQDGQSWLTDFYGAGYAPALGLHHPEGRCATVGLRQNDLEQLHLLERFALGDFRKPDSGIWMPL